MKSKTAIIIILTMLLLHGCNSAPDSKAISSPISTQSTQSEATEPVPVTANMTPEKIYETIEPAVVEIQTFDKNGNKLKLGTGFFINGQGEIITNFHVIDGAASVIVVCDSVTYDVTKVVDYNIDVDLAKLSIETKNNMWLQLEEGETLTGEHVYALGSSLGLTNTFSDGIVSNANFVLDGIKYIQTTAPISSGNSGGPLVNVRGKVVGVNTWGIDEGQNINFAIAVEEVTKLTRNINLPISRLEEIESKPSSIGTGKYTFDLEVTFLDGSVSKYSIHTDCTTVGDALYELGIIDGDKSEYGLFVDTVCGERLDYDTDHTYWTFLINGEYTMKGVDKTLIVSSYVYSFVAVAD